MDTPDWKKIVELGEGVDFPMDPVMVFAKAFSEALEDDNWGDIEPEVFENLGNDCESGDELVYNKYSREEMESAVPAMYLAIKKALEAVGVK